MELQAAKMIYDVDKKQYEAYKAKMEQVTWQKLYRNPDGRLKTTSGNEWDVYLRLQTDSAWNSMTDDAIKLSSPEGSTGPERVTAFRLGRTYDDATSTLHFEGQYKEDPRNKDISLDGPEQPNLSLAGFWGRNETKDVSGIFVIFFETFINLTLNFIELADIIYYPRSSRSAHHSYRDQMAPSVRRRVKWVASAFSRKKRASEDGAQNGEDDIHSE